MNIRKNTFLGLLTMIFVLFFHDNTIAQQASQKPNVIIIYADDLGYGDLSCYGATQIETPNVDQLAAEGLRFTNAHAMASTCTPSRFSLLTGEYAFRNKSVHILPGNAPLLIPLDKATLGTVFQKAGYKTAVVGKWHLGLGNKGKRADWNGVVKPGPNEVGFDYSFIFPATADRVPTVYLKNHQVIGLTSKDPIEVSYLHKVGDDPTGKAHPELLKMQSSHGHDGTIVNGIGRIGWMKGGHLARWTDEELAGDFLAEAKGFIERNKNNPFFLYYAVNEIHVPRMPSTRFKGKSKLGYRGDVILEMDDVVGEIMKTLDYLHLAKNTIIVFSSDNGPVMDDGYVDEAVEKAHGHQPAGPFRGGKYSLFEGGTRMPFIVKWSGNVKPGVSNALISQVDLLASFANLVDVDLNKEEQADSKNLLKVLLGKSKKGRKVNVEQENSGALAYVKNGWKYIAPHKGPALNKNVNIETGYSMDPQLYHLKKDIGEQHNLAKKYQRRVKKMAEELAIVKEGN